MQNSILINFVENGMTVHVDREVETEDGLVFDNKTFVFDKKPKLFKALKILIDQLTEKGE
jgi:hypothetical protein